MHAPTPLPAITSADRVRVAHCFPTGTHSHILRNNAVADMFYIVATLTLMLSSAAGFGAVPSDWSGTVSNQEKLELSLGCSATYGRAPANSWGDDAFTSSFSPAVPFKTLKVIYGNMANGAFGNPSSGATLSINGDSVQALGSYGQDSYSASYTKVFERDDGMLESIGISKHESGSHQSGIFQILIDGEEFGCTQR